MKNKILLIAFLIAVAVAILFFVLSATKNDPAYKSLVACLADRGVLVYGSNTCPACLEFANQFGGYDVIAPIYIECTIEQERCYQEMQTRPPSVPEIQINGNLYEGPRAPEMLAKFVGCEI